MDHRVDEVAEVRRVPHGQGVGLVRQRVTQLAPKRLGHVGAGGGGALLPLVLEGASHDAGPQSVRVRGRVGHDEVLAARLAHEPRVRPIRAEPLAHSRPQRPKDLGGAREVEARELRVVERRVRDLGRVAGDEVDHPRRQAGLLQQLVGEVARENGMGRRLPQHTTAHQRRKPREVAANRREVERTHGVDEPLQRPVVQPVPLPSGRGRLVVVDRFGEVSAPAVEVHQLARRVDLGLVRRLALAQHRRGVEDRPPLGRQQVRRLQEDGRSILPRPRRPLPARFRRLVDRLRRFRSASLVPDAQVQSVVVGSGDGLRPAGADLSAPDHQRNVRRPVRHVLQSGLQSGPFGGPGGVGVDGLGLGRRDADRSGHEPSSWGWASRVGREERQCRPTLASRSRTEARATWGTAVGARRQAGGAAGPDAGIR